MENEKKNAVLTDEELMKIDGGAKTTTLGKRCEEFKTEIEYKRDTRCFWTSYGKCIKN